MDRRLTALAAALFAAGCAGHQPSTPAATAPAAAAPAPPADPTSLRYVAGTARYRVEQTTHVVQELMGQSNATDLTSRHLLSAVASDSGPDLALAMTVDSIEVTGPPGADLGGVSAARGQTFRLVLARSGLVISLQSPDTTNLVLRQFGISLREFFPRIPAAPVTAGQTWTDTLTTSTSGELSVTVRSVRQNRVVGWEDRDGARALHLASTSTYTVSGSGETQGQSVEMSGGGLSSRDAFVSAAGAFLGSVESDSALINANVTSVGLTVPIRQTRRSTVTRLP